MLAIEIDLLAGRYHATPWGRAANEGEPEWPPSPWRLARALASAWWRTPPQDRPDQPTVDGLLTALAEPPRFLLPRGSAAHSRHYMPDADATSANDTALVLDPFVRTDASPITLIWDTLDLDPNQRATLNQLTERVGYLGRSESPCLIRETTCPRADNTFEARPLIDDRPAERAIVTRVLCLSKTPTLDALSEQTAARRKRRLLAPPAGRFIPYQLAAEALRPPRRALHQSARATPVALRFRLEGPALPPLTAALRLAERFRAAALARADDAPPETILRLRGRHPDSGEIAAGHQHAHYLATDEDGDRRLDHLTVWCPAGIHPADLQALDVSTLRSWAFDHPIQLTLLGSLTKPAADQGPLDTARTWTSHTPFLPPRHPKRRGGKPTD